MPSMNAKNEIRDIKKRLDDLEARSVQRELARDELNKSLLAVRSYLRAKIPETMLR